MSKTNPGNYFEDFQLGQKITHATPRTVSAGDVSLYSALYGMRFVLQSSDKFSCVSGLSRSPVDDLLVFHIVFGKSVPDISINAVANLGYADCRFLKTVYVGDTLSAKSEVIGLKQNSNGRTGNVMVRTTGYNQYGQMILQFIRWVMVNKKDPESPAPETMLPELAEAVAAQDLIVPEGLNFRDFDADLSGSPHFWDDYRKGEKISHVDGMTVEAADHMLATRLYQNTAKVHFNQHMMKDGPLGERIVYGGHIISLARALSYNGLGNALCVVAINAGRHVNPTIAGDTVYAWSEILDKADVEDRSDLGALRLRMVALKDQTPESFPHKKTDGKYHPSVLLDLDLWVLMPKKLIQ